MLYVGKAQNLRTRVRSYFSGGDGRVQVPKLVRRVADVGVLATPTVKDALLLENELIKQHKPPFNVRLRDDKQYLALRLDLDAEWPRLTMVRRFKRDGAQYFGPFTSSVAMRDSLYNLRRIFPLRTCSDGTFKDYARRGRPCIEYEMKRCPGPCVDAVTPEDYRELLRGTELFLRGRSEELVTTLRDRMQAASAEQRYEEAAKLRDRIQSVEATVERQQIVTERPVDRDVFGLARKGGEVQIQALHVREGRVIGASEHAFSRVELDDAEVLASFLAQFYAGETERPIPAEVLGSVELADEGALEAWLSERAERRVSVRRPQRAAPRELVQLATGNAEGALARRLDARESVEEALRELQERLGLSELPRRIECYDISNLAGTLAVASRVTLRRRTSPSRRRATGAIGSAKPAAGDDLRLPARGAAAADRVKRVETRAAARPADGRRRSRSGRGRGGGAAATPSPRGRSLIGLSKEREDAEHVSGRPAIRA